MVRVAGHCAPIRQRFQLSIVVETRVALDDPRIVSQAAHHSAQLEKALGRIKELEGALRLIVDRMEKLPTEN